MKYCMKCGTLLEDSHEICIGCGTDVTSPESWSLYPPEMAKKIEIENEEKKSQTGLIIAMIAVFVLLVAAIAVFIVFTTKKMTDSVAETEEAVEEVVEEVLEEPVEEVAEEKEENATLAPLVIEDAKEDEETVSEASGDREVKDSAGRYYNVGSFSDAAGNVIFTTVYPEDFSEKSAGINYEVYSSRYPESFTYIVGNDDGNVQLTFMSPQHYWYRKSDNKGQTRSNERDVDDYMQFLTYSGAEGYIEALIKQSYTDIKGFKLIDKEEYSANVTEKINKVSADHTNELLGEIGDYAKIAPDTVYAAMLAECDANIYHYQATSRQENTIFMDFYVPVIANTLGYVSEDANDKGEVTEWLVPELIAFEAGNEELYKNYSDAFRLFIYNSRLSDEFFYINHAYSLDIESAVKVKRAPVKLGADKIKALMASYKPNAEVNAYAKGVSELLKTHPNSCAVFSGDKDVIALDSSKVGFYSKDKNKVFISDVEDEYPGSDYIDLVCHEGSSEESTADSSDSSSDSE